jgi:hypothetical protein
MTMMTSDLLRPSRLMTAFVFSLVLIGCAVAVPTDTGDPFAPGRASANHAVDDDEAARPRGRVVDATGGIMSFRPTDRAVEVDAEAVSVRQIFDDLGPVAREWFQHVQTLANPFFEGRVPESRGGQLAAEYIEFFFRTYGLEPAFGVGGNDREELGGALAEGAEAEGENWIAYQQPFTFSYRGQRMRTRIRDAIAAFDGRSLTDGEDFTVLGISGSAQVTAPITFVGYAIESGPDGYTSFDDDADLTGRIALVLRYEPADEDGRSQWGGTRFSEHSSIASKIRAARDRGAAGIILVNPPNVRGSANTLERLGRSSQFGPSLNIPAVQLSQEAADELLKRADPHGRGLMPWRRMADAGEVRTVHLNDLLKATIGATMERTGARPEVEASNVGGVLRGRGKLAREWIVIGAHYDHVGHGEFGTSPQYRGMLHPGADDNASGTAGLIVLARTLAQHYENAPEDVDLRSILFIAFDAEESGLRGSRHFVNNPSVALESINAMINMDMIGRLRDNTIGVMGVSTGEGLEELLKSHFLHSGMTVSVTPGSSGRSDDANFINNQIPAIHFFTGLHDDYHAPSDKAHTVNPAGARDLLRLVHHIAIDLATQPEKLVFTEPRRVRTPDRGYGPVRLGIRPGMGEEIERGVQVDAVTPGTSADDAGITRGDIIIGWDDYSIDDMRSLFEALQRHQHGDLVTLTVIRGDEEVAIEVTLKAGE